MKVGSRPANMFKHILDMGRQRSKGSNLIAGDFEQSFLRPEKKGNHKNLILKMIHRLIMLEGLQFLKGNDQIHSRRRRRRGGMEERGE